MRLFAAAEAMLNDVDWQSRRTVVLAGQGWPKGLLGLVASRVAELTRRPAVLLSLDKGVLSGSGRTVPGFNLYAALSAAREFCVSLGGHSEAAGMRLKEESLEAFRAAFEEGASRQPRPPEDGEVTIDFEAEFGDLLALNGAFPDLEPFGQGNPPPNAVLRGVSVTDAAPTRSGGDRHIILRIMDGTNPISLVCFNMAPRLSEVEARLDLVLSYDAGFSNYRLPGWRVVDFKSAGASVYPWQSR
jgi:single-stranded-DNA-specific exonuclease